MKGTRWGMVAVLAAALAVLVLTASPVFGAGDGKLVVFIEVGDPGTERELKDRPDVSLRHEFPNGFSATIPANSREGIERRPGVTVHDVPVHQLTAAPSDADGNPIVPSTPILLDELVGDNIIRPSAPAGPASVTGSIGAVEVSRNPQYARARMHYRVLGPSRFLTPVSMTQGTISTNR